MKRLVFTIVSLFVVFWAKAQVAVDTLSTEALNTLLIEQVERLAEDNEEEIDYEDLLESYIFLSDNPVNINSDEVMRLVELHLISAFQYEELKKYRMSLPQATEVAYRLKKEGIDLPDGILEKKELAKACAEYLAKKKQEA